ncbi:MAG: P-loop NTPase [Polyangia bacterium]
MRITVASGKGGTGKTTFAVNLAYALAGSGEAVRLLDCDVEEPNDHLFVRPEFTASEPVERFKPVWNEAACEGCGDCAAACHYNAIAVVKGKVLVFNELCHSCGVCSYVCPNDAFSERPVSVGSVDTALENEPFPFVRGTLDIAEALAPSVVRQAKKHCDPEAINIIDAAPGTACPVVEAVGDSDVAILLTEPTLFGLNDVKLAVGLTLARGVPTGIVVNRSDGEDEIIASWAERAGVPIIGRIPFSRKYAEAYSRGDVLVRVFPELERNLIGIYEESVRLAATEAPPPPEEERLSAVPGSREMFESGEASDYEEITVISGKGGSGKTTVVSSLAMLAEQAVLADNDVDAADLHLLIAPEVFEVHDFAGGHKATIDPDQCTGCGLCAEACHFEAIVPDDSRGDGVQLFRIDDLSCEGCGLCGHVCDFDAVSVAASTVGQWFVSSTGCGPMAHARLGIAEENSGKLVTQVRNVAAELARNLKKKAIVGDGPPGTGCPVIASVSGADRVLIVTEPTVSGVHDMQRVLELTNHFGVPAQVVINKADLNTEQTAMIEEIAGEMGSSVVAEIPFDTNVDDALKSGKTVVEHGRGPAFEQLVRLAELLKLGN